MKPIYILLLFVPIALFGLLILGTHGGNDPKPKQSHRRNLNKPVNPPIKEHLAEGHHDQESMDHAAFDLQAAHAAGELDETYDDQTFAEEWNDEYFTDGFNITARLYEMFPTIDEDNDGLVTLSEMEKWHFETGMNTSKLRSDREFSTTDENEDGKVSLQEYLGDDFYLIDKINSGHELTEEENNFNNLDWVRTVKDSFSLADGDKDGFLTHAEFFNFLHPEESGNEEMYSHLLQETVRERDENKDGMLSMLEFVDNLWRELKPYEDDNDSFRNHDYENPDENYYEHHEEDPEKDAADKAAAQTKFSDLDKNKDGFLTATELRPEMQLLHPGERDFARRQAQHVVEQADDNKDGTLTIQEMVDNPYVFYSAAMGNDEDRYYHDEFK
mmetsp:Transcript_6040/g.8172  ORF Transcript_6040/g.8172 Transcript_6040/m.8172 type:complete len:386 (+) Transcript_6040:113-1270(+)|eukprot:CAMPEP_0196570928 /NCGR_PEP_ID=MMETSP1081-20130531/1091_1 /TAXON_ID=36882 /ORGANISM="Pyramimonas amylifera, Strain CCMP720" /LENGTH=385 /DNA_ID=CAMNT_0041887631 /DNA_START=101 /DNA_END=1258 /DNA_ORIENTATION=+